MVKISKSKIIFSGEWDNFVVECERCDNSIVVELNSFSEYGVKCTGCDSFSFIYNDGGIYKKVEKYDITAPDNIIIRIQ